MESFSDLPGGWLAAFDIPPVIGAVVLSAIAAWVVLRVRGARMESPAADAVSLEGPQTVEYGDREIEVPAEIVATIARGDRIGAIKALRDTAKIELVDAKRIVDTLARP